MIKLKNAGSVFLITSTNLTTTSKGRLLVVDDETDIVTVVKSGLQRHGYDVDGFSDPYEALANFKKDRYDLILLDIKMPKMNGFELCHEISKIDEDAKKGFMSAFEVSLDDAILVYPTLKALFFLRKPISVQKMVEQIRAFASN